jgi:hypothetical protein
MGYALAEIRSRGWTALVKELGYAGATKFILLHETGEGDYTRDRRELLKGLTIKQFVSRVKGNERP